MDHEQEVTCANCGSACDSGRPEQSESLPSSYYSPIASVEGLVTLESVSGPGHHAEPRNFSWRRGISLAPMVGGTAGALVVFETGSLVAVMLVMIAAMGVVLLTTRKGGRIRSSKSVAALTAIALMVAPASAAASNSLPPGSEPFGEDGVFLDGDAHPALEWSVPGRWDASWQAWDPDTATYDPDFINPSGWSMNLDACSSTSVRRITSYTFTLTQVGGTWKRTRTTSACGWNLHDLLPAQGYYNATVTLNTDWGGGAAGVSEPAQRTTRIHDRLIVSMGDSLASGEGNPDVPGEYQVWENPKGEAHVTGVTTAVQWKDERCHRSAKSGHALAAKALQDQYTSVTFLSVACSGAEIRHLIDEYYEGIHPSTGTVLPQIDAVRAMVGPEAERGERRIDALLVSIGVNDLGFADIIRECAKNFNEGDHAKCVTNDGISEKLEGLDYELLADALRLKLPNIREVYINSYPSNVFEGGACGSLHFNYFGLDATEASELRRWGNAFESKITQTTHRLRFDADRWNGIEPLSILFSGHHYCASTPWFTTYEQSFARQGDENGTAHPNEAGHVEFAGALTRAMAPDQGSTYYRKVTLIVESIKLTPVSGGSPRNIDLSFQEYQNDPFSLTRYISVPQNGQWTPVPADLGRFTLDVYVAPASPRHATALFMSVWHILPIAHSRDDGFGAGSHTIIHPTGRMSVKYTVTTEAPFTDGMRFPR